MPQNHLAFSLRGAAVRREYFDPKNEEHLTSLRKFIATGGWGDVKFFAEAPFTEVPATVMMKYASFALGTPMAVQLISEVGAPTVKVQPEKILAPIANVGKAMFGTFVHKAA